jgi:hypothetical protein
MTEIARELRRRKRARRNLAFFEFAIVLFVLGFLLVMLVVSGTASDMGWLLMLPTILGLVGIMWFVARQPTNL